MKKKKKEKKKKKTCWYMKSWSLGAKDMKMSRKWSCGKFTGRNSLEGTHTPEGVNVRVGARA